jgi:hypothetical protein
VKGAATAGALGAVTGSTSSAIFHGYAARQNRRAQQDVARSSWADSKEVEARLKAQQEYAQVTNSDGGGGVCGTKCTTACG